MADDKTVDDSPLAGTAHKPDTEKLSQALRICLGTLLSVADKIKELEPERKASEPEQEPDDLQNRAENLLDPAYRRPWWPVVAGISGVFLWYWIISKVKD